MVRSPSRREIVGSVSLTLVSGCLERNPQQTDQSGDPTDGNENNTNASEREPEKTTPPEGCELRRRNQRGKGEPIEKTADVDTVEDVNEECARLASEAAFEKLNSELNLDLSGSQNQWIYPSAGRSSGIYTSRILVIASTYPDGEDGRTYHRCPDPAFEYTEAIEAVPQTVKIDLYDKSEETHHSCSEPIRLVERTYHYD